MAALQLRVLRNFFGDFDARINELTSASTRWEAAKIWLLDHFQALVLLTSAVIFPAVLIIAMSDHWDIEYPQPVGCKRLGRSELEDSKDQRSSQDKKAGAGNDKLLQIRPIEGCMLIETKEEEITGPKEQYDRQFCFAQLLQDRSDQQRDKTKKTDKRWRHMTERDFPLLASVKVQLWIPDKTNRQYNPEREAIKNGGSLVVSFPLRTNPALSMQYLQYLYNSCKAKYIRQDWSAQPTVIFDVPYQPSPERMQRKSYRLTDDLEGPQGASEVINFEKEIAPDVLEKMKRYLGASNQLTLFRTDTSHYREKAKAATKGGH